MQKMYCNWSTFFDVQPLWPALGKEPRDRTNCAAAQQAVHIYGDRENVHEHQESGHKIRTNCKNRNLNFTGKHFTYQVIATNCGTVVRKIRYYFLNFLMKVLSQI